MSFFSETLVFAKCGDSAAINSVMEMALRVAKAACGRFILNRSDVEDLAQTVAVKVFKNLSSCRAETESEFVGFVIRVARNTCYDFHRTAKDMQGLGDYDAPSGRSGLHAIEASEILYAAASVSGTEMEVELAIAGCSLSEIGTRLGIGKRRAQRRLAMHKQAVLAMMAE
jgi:RNA polymerase sigma factor (sigma-70 family)